MQSMQQIMTRVGERKGGMDTLAALLTPPSSATEISKTPDDRWLSAITKCVFQAGFKWQLIEDKWPRFEEVFEGFDIHRWRMMSDDDLDRLLKTDGIVRHPTKVRSVRDNAAFLVDIVNAHGGVGAYFSTWEPSAYCRNLRQLHKGGARLGGKTGQIFLRRMGVDTLVFTADVLKALHAQGVVNRMPGSLKDWSAVQGALDAWRDESGLSLNEISQILAFSV